MSQSANVPLKLAGRVVLLAGETYYSFDRFKPVIASEGGKLAGKLTKTVDLIVEMPKRDKTANRALREAREWVKRGQAKIEILDYDAFSHRYKLTAEEVVHLLRGGPAEHKRLEALLDARPNEMAKLSIRGERLVRLKWPKQDGMRHLRFERCDLSGADLHGAFLGQIRQCKLDGANLDGASSFDAVEKSSLVGVSAKGASFPATESDFSDANLEQYVGGGNKLSRCVFRGARLDSADLSRAKLTGSDLREANLEGASLVDADLSGAKLGRANLAGTSLDKAKLKNADLTGANLRGARLPYADLSNAKVEKADFTGAAANGAKLAGVKRESAIGLSAPKAKKTGPKLRALVAAVAKAETIETTLRIDEASGGHVEVKLELRTGSRQYRSGLRASRYDSDGEIEHVHDSLESLEDGFLRVATTYGGGTLRIASIKARSEKSPVSGKALADLVVAAWCEAFDVKVADPAAAVAAAKRAGRERAGSWREVLASGPRGVRLWNLTPASELPKQLRGAKLAGARLEGWKVECDLSRADLTKAQLAEANFDDAKLTGANLAGADLTGAWLSRISLRGARLDGATLVASDLSSADLQGASLVKADLDDADLEYADLRGADLTGASFKGALFDDTKYDGATKLPAGLTRDKGLVWKGKGPPPEPKRKGREPAAIDVATFMKRLARGTDPDRLANALSMLKADRFQLFSDVADGRVAGVVKSQTDAELVYACALDQRGGFSCCTQNLNTCGGLRGKLCKHLLVLIVGLTQAGVLDPTRVDGWVKNSARGRPELDREAMSDIFLRYKGAESGQIDWRPIETLPEDYHAY
jgi:uncharacterized protein YjbI with pentapeptide repeats